MESGRPISPVLWLVTTCVMQMLLIFVAAQAPTPSISPGITPIAAPVAPSASPLAPAPLESPPAPPPTPSPVETPPPAEAPAPITVENKTFTTKTSFVLKVGSSSNNDTGRQSRDAVFSPSGEYRLSLIMDGFGTDVDTQYCWAEVRNTTGNLTFREICDPFKVQKCSLSLSEEGDLRLALESNGAKLNAWNVTKLGAKEVKLDDNGVISLVDAQETALWTSNEIPEKDRCLNPFDPSALTSSGSLTFDKLAIICSAVLGLAISNYCLW